MQTTGTKYRILKEGMALLQKHGYNGFSFQDIADIIKIKKPSLYDHFASKDELMVGIIRAYSKLFDSWVEDMADRPPLKRIQKVFDVFYSFTCDKQKICPVLALGTDLQSLSKTVQKEMKIFVEKWIMWLEQQIKEGQKSGHIRKDMSAHDLAAFIYAQGMGSQFQARINNDPKVALLSGKLITELIRT